MATIYAHWQDAWEFIDSEAHAEAPVTVLNKLIEAAEADFEIHLGRFFTLPFVEATQPQSFALVKRIVSMQAAAEYLERNQQTEAQSTDHIWYPDKLRRHIEEYKATLRSLHRPVDATNATDPVIRLPWDGLSSADRPAVFDNDQVSPGNSDHW